MAGATTVYDERMSLFDARKRYFEDNQFGDDGGYSKKWVELKLGPIPFAIPNTPSRVRAVRYHDLHHIVTGYQTDWIGEFEISAWEVATSCRDFVAAWLLNLNGLAAGMLVAPRRVGRAFLRGRHSKNLYPEVFDDALLATKLGDMRRQLGLLAPRPPSAGDVLALLGWIGVAFCVLLVELAMLLGPVVFAFFVLWP